MSLFTQKLLVTSASFNIKFPLLINNYYACLVLAPAHFVSLFSPPTQVFLGFFQHLSAFSCFAAFVRLHLHDSYMSALLTTPFSVLLFSRSVVSDSLWPHGLQHTRPSCPSPTPGIYSNSWPLSQWCYPTISSSVVTFSSRLQSFPAPEVFPTESVLWIRRPKYCSFNFSISASNEYSGLISFRMDWLDIVAVQGTLKSLPQHHSSKASILQYSAFFILQLSHPYMTTGKAIALTRRTFVGKVMSLLFNMLSRLVITFLPRSKCLLISWLQSPSTMILEPPKIKSLTISIASPSICHEVMGPDAMIFVFWMLSINCLYLHPNQSN